MRHPEPRGFSRRLVERLLLATDNDASVSRRIDVFSRLLLAKPYQANPLVGSAQSEEVFTAALDGFDCVTYIETVLALARASTADDFVGWLRRIRYRNGTIRWECRNHYMTSWIGNNLRQRILETVSAPGIPVSGRDRVLQAVPGLGALRTRVRCVPKRAVPRLSAYMRTGDLIFFASTRSDLDVFHAGILVREGQKSRLRHASRSQGLVVEQDLSDFLKSNRMAGVVVVRPRECARAAATHNRDGGCLSMPRGWGRAGRGAARRQLRREHRLSN
jgi:hypothetical protein